MTPDSSPAPRRVDDARQKACRRPTRPAAINLSEAGEMKIKKIGAQLKAIREKKGLTPNYVAVRLGQRTTNLHRIENGESFQIDTLLRVCQILDCEIDITIK